MASDAHWHEASPEFEIEVGDGRAVLLLRAATFFGWLQVDLLSLSVPAVSFPLDITAGMAQFQRQRCRLTSGALSVDDAGLARFIDERQAALRTAGFDDVALRLTDGAIDLAAVARVGSHTSELVARIYAEPEGRRLRLWIGDILLYGYLPRPAPLVAHDLACMLLRAGDGPPEAVLEPDLPVAVGLGQFLLPPFELFAAHALSPAGWLLPDASRARIVEAGLTRGRADLRFASAGVEIGAFSEAPAAGASAREALERFRIADNLLLRGDLDGAGAAYRADQIRHPEHEEFLAGRLLQVACARPSTLRDGERLAEQLLERWPDFRLARLALAAVALARDRVDAAAAHMAGAADLAERAGDVDGLVRAATCAARLLRDRDPVAALALYRRTAARQPDHAEAVAALAEYYRSARDWTKLVQLLERQVEVARDPRARARLCVELGRVHFELLDDPQAACDALERATRAAPDHIPSWDGLLGLYERLDDTAAAIAAGETLAGLLHARGDEVGEGRAHARLAALHGRAGAGDRAYASIRAALARLPDDPAVVEEYADRAAAAGDGDDAIAGYHRLLDPSPADGALAARVAGRLVRLHTQRGELDDVRIHLRAAISGLDGEALVAVAALEEAAGRPDVAAELLDRAVPLLTGERAAEIGAALADLLWGIGRESDARAALERAHAAAPASRFAQAAARRLAADAAGTGDGPAEARWLEALLAAEVADAPALRFRCAQLAMAAGDPVHACALVDGFDPAAIPGGRRLHAEIIGALGDALGKARVLEQLAAESADDPAHIDLLIDAAQARIEAGDPGAAEALARRALRIAPGSAAAVGVLGDAAWHARAWEDVIAIHRDRVGAGDLIATYRTAAGLERLGRMRDACQVYRTALDGAARGAPMLDDCWSHLGELYAKLGEYAEAAAAYASAAADPRLDGPPGRRAELHTRAAELLHRRLGRSAVARAQVDRALALAPDHVPALDILESISVEEGNPAGVLAVLARKLELATGDEDRRNALLARIAAIEVADQTRPPGGADSRLTVEEERIRRLIDEVGDLEAALAAWNEARQAFPGAPSLVVLRRRIADAFEAAVREAATEIDAAGVASAAAADGELRVRIDELESARNQRPHDPYVLEPLADLYLQVGAFHPAIDTLRGLLAVRTGNHARAEIRYRIAEIHRVHLRAAEDAADEYLKASDLDPQHAPTLLRLIEYYWSIGNHQELRTIVDELERLGKGPESDAAVLACVALSAHITGDAARARAAAAVLGAAGADAVVWAVIHGAGLPPEQLAGACRVVCAPPGPPLDQVRRRLYARGVSERRCRALADVLGE